MFSRSPVDAPLAEMNDEFLQVRAADDSARSMVAGQSRPPSLEDLPHVPIRLRLFGCDVVKVDVLAEETLKMLIDATHGDRGSFLTTLSSRTRRNSYGEWKLVGMTGFEPATP